MDSQIEIIRLKKERLGLVFADGAISKDTYTQKLHNLNKQERELLKVRGNLNPEALAEIAEVENTIKSIEKMLDASGSLLVSDFGIWGYTGDTVAPLGYNPWLETECKNEVGRLREMGYVRVEGTDLKIKAIGPPEGFWFSENPVEVIKKNIRAILQKFEIRVYVFRDRIEVRGLIQSQIIKTAIGDKPPSREPIIPSVRGEG